MTGPLTINTSSGDAYVNVKNSSHGWQMKATSVTRGIFDNKASQFIIYQTLSDTTNTLNIAAVPVAIASNLTASGTAAFNGATTFTNTVALNNKTTVASGTSLYFGGTTYYVSGAGVANLKNIVANGTLKATGATTLQSTLAVTETSSFTGAISASSTIAAVGNISSEGTISAPYITASAKLTSTGTAVIGSNHATQALTVTGGATFGETIVAKKAEIGASGATIGGTTTAQHINPSAHNTYSLGTDTARWKNIYAQGTVYATTFSGNATSASKLNASRAVTLSGDVGGTGSSNGSADWNITTTIGTGKVTNAMLAGSIANNKLVNSSVNIAGTSVSLGGSITAEQLRINLGLTNAMHYIGVATVAITNQSNTDPKISGYTWPDDRLAGDVVIYGTKEYVWNSYNSRWELLGDEGSYKVLQTAVSSPGTSGNASAFIDTISQDTNGKITVTKKNVQINISATATDDDIVVLTGTAGTNGVTYDAKHAKKGPSSGYTSGNTVTTLTGAATSFAIPQITVDTYGHTNKGADETITITLPKSGAWFNNGFVTVNGSGVSEIGRYLDFHKTNASTADYDVRIDSGTANSNVFNLPNVAASTTGYQFVVHTNDTAIGSGVKPVYIAADGAATASTSTVGSGIVPMYLNAGTLTASSSTVGASNNPVFLNSGTITASTSDIGSATKPIYMEDGIIKASGASVGASAKPIFLNAGTLTASSSTLGSTTQPVYMSSGEIKALTGTAGSASVPVYLNGGIITSCDASSLFSNFSSTAGANGETLSITVAGKNRTVTLDAANATQGGVVTTGAQTFAGAKTFNDDIRILTGDTDKFIIWEHQTTNYGAEWRAGVLGTGSSNANYFVLQTSGSGTNTSTEATFNNAMRIGMDNKDVTFYGTTSIPTLQLTNALAVAYGGTGITSNPSMLVNLGSTTAANVFAASPRPGITGTLGVGHGGTGKTSWTAYGLVYASSSSALASLGTGTAGQILTSGGSSAAPSWKAVTNSGPTLAWGQTSTIGTVAGVDLKVTMPANPNTNTNYYHTPTYTGGLSIATGTGVATLYVPNAATNQAGVVTTGTQSFAGTKTFTGVVSITNTTAATNTTSGALKVSGGLGVAGAIYGTKVYNAVWNDYAEFRKAETVEPGRVVIEDISGEMKISTERLQAGASIVSDTFGSAMGETNECKTPLAVAGRALAYTYEDRNSYPLGAAVCTGPNGTVSLMTREEIMMYPDRIVGTVSEIPNYETWGTGNVEVNGRIWIKVR